MPIYLIFSVITSSKRSTFLKRCHVIGFWRYHFCEGPRYRWPVWAASSASAQIGEKTPASRGSPGGFMWAVRHQTCEFHQQTMGYPPSEIKRIFINKMWSGVSDVLKSCKFLTLSWVEQKSWTSSDTYDILQSLGMMLDHFGNPVGPAWRLAISIYIYISEFHMFRVEIMRSMVSRLI